MIFTFFFYVYKVLKLWKIRIFNDEKKQTGGLNLTPCCKSAIFHCGISLSFIYFQAFSVFWFSFLVYSLKLKWNIYFFLMQWCSCFNYVWTYEFSLWLAMHRLSNAVFLWRNLTLEKDSDLQRLYLSGWLFLLVGISLQGVVNILFFTPDFWFCKMFVILFFCVSYMIIDMRPLRVLVNVFYGNIFIGSFSQLLWWFFVHWM